MAFRNKTITGPTNPHNEHLKFEIENSDRCHRCGGFMAREYCFDLLDETGHNGFWALRCMQCGEILDPLILQNRNAQHPVPLKDRARRKEGIATSHF